MTMLHLVTVKLPRNPNHDPKNKRTGPCPVGGTCTDVTGEHHTYAVRTDISAGEVAAEAQERWGHVTRVESVPG